MICAILGYYIIVIKNPRFFTLEDGTDRSSRNVGMELPLYGAQYPRRVQISCLPYLACHSMILHQEQMLLSIDCDDYVFLDFKLSPCSLCSMFSFGYFPGVWVLKADVSEPSIGSIFIHLPMKMEPIEGSETSAFKTQIPGQYPKENILHDYICCIQEQMVMSCFGVDFEAKPNQRNWTSSGLILHSYITMTTSALYPTLLYILSHLLSSPYP